MELSLTKLSWEVKGYWPYVPIKEKSMETGQTLQGVTDWLSAHIPGGVHYDLWKAGLIEDPYFGQNSLKCEWVENRWWMYRTSFPAEMGGRDLRKEKVILRFLGLDYEAEVFFNDVSCGSHEGMYTPFEVDLTGRIREENRLLVLMKGIPHEMAQIGFTSRTFTQKSRFNYKWDFSTHLVNIGIWQDVLLHVPEAAEFAELHVDTGLSGKAGQIFLAGKTTVMQAETARKLSVKVTLEGPVLRESEDVSALKSMTEERVMAEEAQRKADIVHLAWMIPVRDGVFSETLEVENPAPWNPNGAGNPWLYRLKLELEDEDGQVLDRKEKLTGIRSLSMEQNEDAPEGALPYTFVVNGRKIYIKGVNMTPLDHLYGNVTDRQYEHMVAAMVNAGVNLVRVWGGGLIEKEVFYDLCDANGILIWQEFIQSSSGIDNIPSQRPEFLKLLKETAIAAVKEKRNHVSLAVYSGGNELMEAPDRPCGYDNPNIAMLKGIVEQYDGRRLFLPTSASGPREFVTREKGVSHDVHGNWRYEGNPGHYELYGQSDSLFHSEFGMDATTSVKSLKKFLPEASLYPTPMVENQDWQHHGEWWGTYFRDCELFGPIAKTPENLQLFTRCSQYMQGEGLRFILEADRKRAFHNSGVIIWQINEPWPNSSCTNLVDWYGETKTAYYQTKRAYEACHISLDYRSLSLSAGAPAEMQVYVENDGDAFEAAVRVQIRDLSGTVIREVVPGEKNDGSEGSGEKDLPEGRSLVRIPENGACRIGSLAVDPAERELIFLTLLLETQGRCISENTYVFGTGKPEVFAPLRKVPGKAEIRNVVWKDGQNGRKMVLVTVKNTGERAVLDAGVELKTEGYALLGTDNDRILFPREERTFSFLLIPKDFGGFAETGNYDGTVQPELTAHWL